MSNDKKEIENKKLIEELLKKYKIINIFTNITNNILNILCKKNDFYLIKKRDIGILIEKIIINKIKNLNLSFQVISKYSKLINIVQDPKYILLLDPIDGFGNFLNNNSIYSISMSIIDKKSFVLLISYIKNLKENEEYIAINKLGTYINKKKIKYKHIKKKFFEKKSKIIISLYTDKNKSIYFKNENKLIKKNIGCISLEYCYLAIGKIDLIMDIRKNISLINIISGLFFFNELNGITYDFYGENINCKLLNMINLKKYKNDRGLISLINKDNYKIITNLIKFKGDKYNYHGPIKNVAFLFNINNISKIKSILLSLLNFFKNKVNIILPENITINNNIIFSKYKKIKISKIKYNDVDLMIIIGGDGTFLHNIHKLKEEIPIVGINVGKVGFLTDINPKNAKKIISNLINGFWYEKINRLELLINNNYECNFINEIVLTSMEKSKILSYELYINDYFIKTIRADGILFSTSIGSTAYALSNGGPLIHPSIEIIEIIPIAPFSLISRPLIIPINSEVRIAIQEKQSKIIFIADGKKLYNKFNNLIVASNNDIILIKKHQKPINIVKINKNCFYKKINQKLNFNKDN